MLFRVPMPYKVTGTIKGKRNPSTEAYWEYVEIDIPVLNDDIAPVAVIWDDSLPDIKLSHKMDEDNWTAINKVPIDGIQMVRVLDDQYYLRRADRMNPEQIAATLTPGSGIHVFGQRFVGHDETVETPVANTPYREDRPFESTFQQELDRLRDNASRFFIVGNDMFELSSEPVVIKVKLRSENFVALVPRVVPLHCIDQRTLSYNIERYSEVVGECNEYSERYGDGPMIGMERAPTIFVEDAFNYDDQAVNLINAVTQYVSKIDDRVRLSSVNPDYGIAFLSLKKALIRYNEDKKNLDPVEDCVSVLVENFSEEVQYSNLPSALADYSNRAVDVATANRKMR